MSTTAWRFNGTEGADAAVLRLKQLDGQDLIDVQDVTVDMTPGTSALVLLSADAPIDTVAQAFEGHAMELMRSDLSVQQEDRLRAAFAGPAPPASEH